MICISIYSHKGQENAKYGVLQKLNLMKKHVIVNVPYTKIHVSFLESLSQNSVSVYVQTKRHATFPSFLIRPFATVIAGSSFAKNHKSRILITVNVNAHQMHSVHHTKF